MLEASIKRSKNLRYSPSLFCNRIAYQYVSLFIDQSFILSKYMALSLLIMPLTRTAHGRHDPSG
jgi:hypothetical protein